MILEIYIINKSQLLIFMILEIILNKNIFNDLMEKLF